MAEILFSCECGRTLKADPDTQSGGKITCPSCKESVRVPLVKRPKVTPPVQGMPIHTGPEIDNDLELQPETAGGMGLGIVYLGVITLVTIGAVACFLIPALTSPEKPKAAQVAANTTKDSTKKPKKPGTKKPKPIEDRPADEPKPKASAEADPAPPVSPPVDVTDPPAPPTPPKEAIKPEEKPAPPSPKSEEAPMPPNTPEPKSDGAPYSHIKDPKVRQYLTNALRNAKVATSAGSALRNINNAEKESNNDPAVLVETKKLKDMINEARKRAP